MTTYIKIFLAIISISLFSACEKTADIDIPDNNPELVVAAFISPQDDSVRIKLSWTKPVYYTNYDNYNNDYEDGATVVISKGSNDYLLKYDSFQNFYVSDGVNLKAGDNIKLRVTHDNDELISDCNIPVEPLYEIEYLGGDYINSNGWEEYTHKVKIVCKNTQELSYYRVAFEFKENSMGYIEKSYGSREFVEMSYGESIVFKIQGDRDNINDSLIVHIINADESYFKYHKSVENQYMNDGFFSEPALIFSNVEGGIGVFSSYNQKDERFFIN